MLTFGDMKKIYANKTIGQVILEQSDMAMEEAWYSDPQHRVAYFFDCDSDPDPYLLKNMTPTREMTPVDIKFVKHTSQTYSKDFVTYHIMFKPSYEPNVPGYEEKFEKRYGAEFPCGLYFLMKDSKGILNRWIVVGLADAYDIQFPTYEVLRCTDCYNWIVNGKKYSFAGARRLQSSYNSGLWTDYKTTSQEDQDKFIVPLTRETELLFYDTRMIIDAPVLKNPRAWKISKVNRLDGRGLNLVTIAQDKFNQHTDIAEFYPDGNVKCWWADALKDVITQPHEFEGLSHGEITYSGLKPQIKIGGSYKTFTYKGKQQSEWSFFLINKETKNRTEASDYVTVLPKDENTIKVKFIGNEQWIGHVLEIGYGNEKVEVDIVSL